MMVHLYQQNNINSDKESFNYNSYRVLFICLKLEKGHKKGNVCKLSNLKHKKYAQFGRIIQVLPVQVCSSYPYPSVL